ncbi:hypothetical protein [Thalassotalea sp. G20_0]|nr:hypothetical protein [Thalassotalea sp. G20_0]
MDTTMVDMVDATAVDMADAKAVAVMVAVVVVNKTREIPNP